MMLFVQDATPELVVEKVNFLGDADADTYASFRSRKSACRKIRRITDLLGNLQNALASGFLDATAPVQRAVHGADGDIRHFGDAVDSVFLLVHLIHSAIPRAACNACFYAPRCHARSNMESPPNGRLVSAVPGPL